MNISIVIPAYNEEENIEPLYSMLTKALGNMEIVNSYEIIFVDDSSNDLTYSKLKSIDDSKVNVIRLNKHMKKTTALNQGFKKVKHNVIITLDADLQYDPLDIEDMLKKIQKGYDCVCGWRYIRSDPFIKIISSKIANMVRRFVLKDNFNDISCGFIGFRKECIENIEFFKGAHRFLPLLIQKQGYRVTEHKVKHKPRKFGKSKYNIRNRIFKTTADLLYVRRIIKNGKNNFYKQKPL